MTKKINLSLHIMQDIFRSLVWYGFLVATFYLGQEYWLLRVLHVAAILVIFVSQFCVSMGLGMINNEIKNSIECPITNKLKELFIKSGAVRLQKWRKWRKMKPFFLRLPFCVFALFGMRHVWLFAALGWTHVNWQLLLGLQDYYLWEAAKEAKEKSGEEKK